MVVMVGGKIVPDGSEYNYNTIITTAGGPQYMSEEKEEVDDDDVVDVEAKVVVDAEARVVVEEEDNNEFANYIDNLPKEIAQVEGSTPTKKDPPAMDAASIAKEAVAAAVAELRGGDDDGGGKPAAVAVPDVQIVPKPLGGEAIKPANQRTRLDPNKDAKWMAMVDKLTEFKALNGHCNVPYHRPPMLTSFQSWIHSQRRLYRTGRMHPVRIETLESVGLRWSAEKGSRQRAANLTWEQRFAQLHAYKQKHGTIEVDKETLWLEEMALNNWCFNQRQKYHAASLPSDRIQQMDAIGFDWGLPLPMKVKREPKEPGEETPKKRPASAIITATAAGTGATNPPPAKKAKVGAPAKAVPIAIAPAPLPPAPLPPDEPEWVEMFDKLQKIKRKNKTIPVSFPQDKPLDRWVRHQKMMMRKEDLHRSRMERLVRLGFVLPKGTTLHNYQNKPPEFPKTAPAAKKWGQQPAGSPQKTLAAAAATAVAVAKKQAVAAKKAPAKKFVPPKVMTPPGFPHGATMPPPGSFPPWNPFMHPHFPYGPPPGMPGMPYGMPGMPPPGMPGAPAAAKKGAKKGSSPMASAQNQPTPPMLAQMMSQKDSLQATQTENAKLRAENEQLQAMHRSMMTSLEEEKMVRRQGNQELQSKLEKQEQVITIQGSTIKKQGQQMKELMDQMKDVITRQKEQQSVQAEHLKKQQEDRLRLQQEEVRLAELQRQREMQELQRQQEEQERAEQQRQRDQVARQNELYVLRQHGLF